MDFRVGRDNNGYRTIEASGRRPQVPVQSGFGLLVDPADVAKPNEVVRKILTITDIERSGAKSENIAQVTNGWLEEVSSLDKALGKRSRIVEATDKDGKGYLVQITPK